MQTLYAQELPRRRYGRNIKVKYSLVKTIGGSILAFGVLCLLFLESICIMTLAQ